VSLKLLKIIQLILKNSPSDYLAGHNDNTYFNDAAGLQILHCILDDCTGGENFLIDGFQVAAKLKVNHPDIYHRLTTTRVPAEFIENGRHHTSCSPIIHLDPLTNEPSQIRFNDADRAPLNTLKPSEIRCFYRDLKFLAKEFGSEENQIAFKLKPGRVMIFDNWRVLHGRMAYTGRRTMSGSYVSRTEFQSVLRVNGFIN
jgi:trimethyllysine dioxygenase